MSALDSLASTQNRSLFVRRQLKAYPRGHSDSPPIALTTVSHRDHRHFAHGNTSAFNRLHNSGTRGREMQKNPTKVARDLSTCERSARSQDSFQASIEVSDTTST
ncbi:hypothetical protein PISMIDRAFT_675518 [Pisolithus microcarpus 441]|uniref:Uncharacterized protein n=1 Tax=Pisolithus microcarpus 441 TaxID=765257 RepID=A0A0C9ZKX5_9AGAM|nr:hypothetical protein PISMIDRAFT_675518 [Pisolithus microcarpus 441]